MVNQRHCVIFRYDLDEISKKEFHYLKGLIKGLDIPATIFLLPHQYCKEGPICFPKGMPEDERKRDYLEYTAFISKRAQQELLPKVEFALHSEAKPLVFNKENIIDLYTKNLIRQKENFILYFGRCNGHSAHSDNAGIFINLEGDTEENRDFDSRLINLSSSAALFRWFSSIKEVVHFTDRDTSFRPLECPYRVNNTIVYPMGWDDHFCYLETKATNRWITKEKILESLLSRLKQSRDRRMPLVVSFHPMRFINSNSRYLYPFEVISDFVDILRQNNTVFDTFTRYSEYLDVA